MNIKQAHDFINKYAPKGVPMNWQIHMENTESGKKTNIIKTEDVSDAMLLCKELNKGFVNSKYVFFIKKIKICKV